MSRTNHTFTNLIFVCFILLTNACTNKSNKIDEKLKDTKIVKKFNPVVYFEIPVLDIDRAVKFYTSVFNFTFEKEVIDKNEMALFPFTDKHTGISGALAKGEIYKPTKDGVVIYFKTENIEATLKLATEMGGKILYPKTSNGDLGFVAEFEDCEGNRIALHQSVQ
jgi:uncharacterized protein